MKALCIPLFTVVIPIFAMGQTFDNTKVNDSAMYYFHLATSSDTTNALTTPEAYSRAIEHDSMFHQARFHRALLNRLLWDWEAAYADFQVLVNGDLDEETTGICHFLSAEALIEMERTLDAYNALQQGKKWIGIPEAGDALRIASTVYEKMAEEKVHPDRVRLYLDSALLLAHTWLQVSDDDTVAFQQVERLYMLDTVHYAVEFADWLARHCFYYKWGLDSLAQYDCLKRVLGLYPGQWKAAEWIGLAERMQGNSEQAIEIYTHCMEANPDMRFAAQEARAYAYWEQKELHRAMDDLGRVIDQESDQYSRAVLCRSRAMMRMKLGQYTGAVDDFMYAMRYLEVFDDGDSLIQAALNIRSSDTTRFQQVLRKYSKYTMALTEYGYFTAGDWHTIAYALLASHADLAETEHALELAATAFDRTKRTWNGMHYALTGCAAIRADRKALARDAFRLTLEHSADESVEERRRIVRRLDVLGQKRLADKIRRLNKQEIKNAGK